MVDYHVIMDLLPIVSSVYFEKRLGEEVKLGAVQSSILLALGLQRKTIEQVEGELDLPVNQALALFVKSIRKISKRLMDIQKSALEAELPPPPTSHGTEDRRTLNAAEALEKMKPVEVTIDDELREAGDEVNRELREKQREMINSLDLSKYAIDTDSADWAVAENQIAKAGRGSSTVVSVKGSADKKRKFDEASNEGGRGDEKRGKIKGDKKTRRSMKKAKR